jgi:hypothetical protein
MKVKLILSIIWGLAGALILKLAASWNRLPDRVAVHFNARLEANGWSTRASLAAIMLLAVLGEAILGTVVLLRVPGGAGFGGMIVLAVNVVLVSAFWQTINYNARGSQFRPLWMFLPLIALFAGLAAFLVIQTLSYQRR